MGVAWWGGPAGAWAHGDAAQRKEERENGFFKSPGSGCRGEAGGGQFRGGGGGGTEPKGTRWLWPRRGRGVASRQGVGRRRTEPLGLEQAPVTEPHR